MSTKYRLTTPTGFEEFTTNDAAVAEAAALGILDPVITPIEYTLPTPDPYAALAAGLERAANFGAMMLRRYQARFLGMGAKADGMTSAIRLALSDTAAALIGGFLTDSIAEARAIPEERKDPKYITDVMLLQFINEIETYLGLPLSGSL